MQYRGFRLDDFQARAFESIQNHRSVIVSAPTGSGKTLIAEYAVECAVKAGRRVIYTAPIKALSNQKFRDFSVQFPDEVGIMTGDVTLNPRASILIMTTEIFRNSVLEEPDQYRDIDYLVFDEVHFLQDVDRGTVWEESIIFAPEEISILALSATIPNLDELAGWIAKVRNIEVDTILDTHRPVPLSHNVYRPEFGVVRIDKLHRKQLQERSESRARGQEATHALLDEIVEEEWTPCLYFCFGRMACENLAWANRHRDLLDPEERESSLSLLKELSQRYEIDLSPKDQGLGSLLVHGVGFHHAGMLPTAKEVVEQFFTRGLVKLLFATETFAMGINMPASTVVFDGLVKYDGTSMRPLRTIEYQQMAGRAGRRGMDEVGMAIANLGSESLGYWTVRGILTGDVEPIQSQFNLGYATILSLYERLGDQIREACSNSFATFQAARTGKKARRRVIQSQRRILQQRLSVLRMLGYLDSETHSLTDRGRFALHIGGFELPVTELFFAGAFEQLAESQIAGLVTSLIFEGKKRQWYNPVYRRASGPYRKAVRRAARRIQDVERLCGLTELTRQPDFRLCGAADGFVRGTPFEGLGKFTNAGEGDIVRTFRYTIQILRQIKKAVEDYEEFTTRLSKVIGQLSRGQVDAERQLRAGVEVSTGPESTDSATNS
jgi:superfamily II RNA helicase